jgi:branched-chain amino acid transport system ATP-binding protein
MLCVRGLSAGYGSVRVLNSVDLSVPDGEILVRSGRNGVGKTTLMRVLVGLVKPSSGRIDLNGKEVAGLPPYRIARAGVGYVPQGRGIFAKLTVRENLLIGTRAKSSPRVGIPERVFSYFPVLKQRINQQGGTLSGGEQQMLAIARALCGDPSILLLDEPSEGIQPNIVRQFGQIIRHIVREIGIAVLLVEQNLDLGLSLATRCAIMERGAIVLQGTPEAFQDEEVLRKYLAL